MSLTQPDGFILQGGQIRFRRDENDEVLLLADGREQVVANVLSAFPLTHPTSMVSLRDPEGREIGILEDVGGLDPESARILREALERSYFMPRITDIHDIKEVLNVVEWEVQTNKGPRTFQVRRVRQNVRRMGLRRLVIKDVDGNRYEVRDWIELPAYAQKLLEPYL